jgi:hypothetical protein
MKKTAKTEAAERSAEIQRLCSEYECMSEPSKSPPKEAWQTLTIVAETAQCMDAELFRKSPQMALRQTMVLLKATGSLPVPPTTVEGQARLAKVAVRMNPELCKTNPKQAVELAAKTILRGGAAIADDEIDVDIARLNELFERQPFKGGVKLLTGEKNIDRAVSKFERFMTATFIKDGEAAEWIKYYRGKGFTLNQMVRLQDAFDPWWKQEKSNRARQSALAKKKYRGRVKRPKSDLRFTENRRHKQGYCQKCGKQVRKSERLCDEHLSGKSLLLKPKASVFSHDASSVGEIDTTLSTLAKETDALPDTYERLYEHLDGETEA